MDGQRPVLANRRGERVLKPALTKKKVEHWEEVTVGERGQETIWLPTGAEESLLAVTGRTAAIAATMIRPSQVTVPANAVAFKLLVIAGANTVTAGHVNVNIFRDKDGSTLGHTAMRVGLEMESVNASSSQVGDVPIVSGGVWYATAIAGTVNYDLTFYIVGFVLK